MLIAISGTPGTGKTSTADVLEARGYRVHRLSDMIEAWEEFGPADRSGSVPVDVDELGRLLSAWAEGQVGTVFLDGHLSYLAPADAVLVLRVNPDLIKARLSLRSYSEEKIKDNAEAEGVSVVLIEALNEMEPRGLKDRVFERDVTDLTSEECADWAAEVVSALEGEDFKSIVRYRPGEIDWTEVIFGWY